MKVKLNENEYKLFKSLIKENQESDSQKKAMSYAMEEIGMDKNEAERYVRETLRAKVKTLNGNSKAGKFTLGALRILYTDVTNTIDLKKLEMSIKIITNNEELYKKYDKNLNNMNINDLYDSIKEYITPNILSKKVSGESRYKIVPIDSYKEAHKFEPYVSWCICASSSRFMQYSENNTCRFYFALRDDYKELNSKMCQDEELFGNYGLSMLAICIETNGELKSCTCRWNHDKGGNDHCMNVEEIEEALNLNFYETFKVGDNHKKKQETLKEIEKRLYNAKTYKDIVNISRDDSLISYGNEIRFYKRENVLFLILNDNTLYTYLMNNYSMEDYENNGEEYDRYDENYHIKLLRICKTSSHYFSTSRNTITNKMIITQDEEFKVVKVYNRENGEEINDYGKIRYCKVIDYEEDIEGGQLVHFETSKGDILVDGDGEKSDIIEQINATKIERISPYTNDYDSNNIIIVEYCKEGDDGRKVAVFDREYLVMDNAIVENCYGDNIYYLKMFDKERSKLIYDSHNNEIYKNIKGLVDNNYNVLIFKCVLENGEDGVKIFLKDDYGIEYFYNNEYKNTDYYMLDCENNRSKGILATKDGDKGWHIFIVREDYGIGEDYSNCKIIAIDDSYMLDTLFMHCIFKDSEGDIKYIDEDGDVGDWNRYYDDLVDDVTDSIEEYKVENGLDEDDDVDLDDVGTVGTRKLSYIQDNIDLDNSI